MTTSSIDSAQINLTLTDSFDDKKQEHISQYYNEEAISHVLTATLNYMDNLNSGNKEDNLEQITYPAFIDIDPTLWQKKPKALEVYITDMDEARALNLEARGKDYATNILSYPSELPGFILEQMPELSLGELIICFDVVEAQASEQNKTLISHATHLLVHGTLHLLGFDHELGNSEADEMEGFEIKIMAQLGFDNPYA